MVGFRKQTSQRLNQLDEFIATLSARVQTLEDERAATAQTLNDIVERTDALDARITSTSTELARQLDELGTELATFSDQEPVDVVGIVNGALDEIRRGQMRLANEQARYQSAFRTDIAVLIEQLRQ